MAKVEPTYLDFREAKKFITKEHSCCQVIRTRKHMTLSPKYIGQISTGIKENLDSELKFFSQVLDGIPVAYSNKFTFAQSSGTILDDCPYIHFDVVVDCVVFQPKIGSSLIGCVNKLGRDHVGCVVHGLFNASILRPHGVPYKEWEGSKLSGGDEFVFEVVKLCTQSGLLSITGKFTNNSVSHKRCKRKRTESNSAETILQGDLSLSSDAIKELPLGTEVIIKHKKKKHKQSKCLPESVECTQTQHGAEKDRLSVGSVDSGIGVNTSECDQPKKTKKKKKKKDKEREENTDVANGGMELLELQGEQSKTLDKAFGGNYCNDLKPETSVREFEHKHQKKKKKHKKDSKDL